eukprot:s5569_g2.t2
MLFILPILLLSRNDLDETATANFKREERCSHGFALAKKKSYNSERCTAHAKLFPSVTLGSCRSQCQLGTSFKRSSMSQTHH